MTGEPLMQPTHHYLYDNGDLMHYRCSETPARRDVVGGGRSGCCQCALHREVLLHVISCFFSIAALIVCGPNPCMVYLLIVVALLLLLVPQVCANLWRRAWRRTGGGHTPQGVHAGRRGLSRATAVRMPQRGMCALGGLQLDGQAACSCSTGCSASAAVQIAVQHACWR